MAYGISQLDTLADAQESDFTGAIWRHCLFNFISIAVHRVGLSLYLLCCRCLMSIGELMFSWKSLDRYSVCYSSTTWWSRTSSVVFPSICLRSTASELCLPAKFVRFKPLAELSSPEAIKICMYLLSMRANSPSWNTAFFSEVVAVPFWSQEVSFFALPSTSNLSCNSL